MDNDADLFANGYENTNPVTGIKIAVLQDSTGAKPLIPGIVTRVGELKAFTDFLISNSSKSLKWKLKARSAVIKFLQYLDANPHESNHFALFRNFSERIYCGTFDLNGIDPSNLCWHPMSAKEAGLAIDILTVFFKHLGNDAPNALKFNPKVPSTGSDRLLISAAYWYKKEGAMLGHTWQNSPTKESTEFVHAIKAKSRERKRRSRPPKFPEDYFDQFVMRGFLTGTRLDIRGQLITLLLDAGGLRVSEAFHLYICDVQPDPENPASALVMLHHPVRSLAPEDWRNTHPSRRWANRERYLKEEFGLLPRNKILGAKHAGYKCIVHVEESGYVYRQVHWARPERGEEFLRLWYVYLQQILPLPRRHPFAFVNTEREPLGDIYSIGCFNKAHQRAVNKVGLPFAKSFGTTPHGHRHAYGQRLKEAELSDVVIMRCMGHASTDSQEVYTAPSEAAVTDAVRKAFAGLHKGALSTLNEETSDDVHSV